MRNQCSKLVQLVHPLCNISNMDFCSSPQTRPTIISTTPKPQTPIWSITPHQSNEQFGSPKTFLLSPSMINHTNVSYPYYYVPESRFAYQAYTDFNDIPIAAPPVFKTSLGGEDGEHDKEEAKEIIREILELFERLPSSLKDKVAMEIIKKEMSKQKDLNIGSSSSTTKTRGIGGLVEDSSMKMERFKVKTVVIGDVIKDDQKN